MTFNIGEFGKSLLNIGTGITNTALTYGIMKDMNSCGGSIWGGYFGGGYSFGGGYPMMGLNYGAINVAGQAAYMQGVQDRLAIEAQRMAEGLLKTNNTKAEAVSDNQDTSKAEAFENATKSMMDKDGEVVSGEKFSLVSDDWKKSLENGGDAKELAKQYKASLSDLGKSYLRNIDKLAGNSDGYVTEKEFVQHSLNSAFAALPSDATEEEKAEYEAAKAKAEQMARNAFAKLDQNGDKVIDWKESAAMFAAADAENLTGNINGEIASEDFAKLSESITQSGTNTADKALRKGYTSLFGNQKK